ncbi:tyrosine-type recombinase/integrase [Niallia taxi]|uniref:tyrosine-type recombinase/integrase n=1 Tax=Niallia taxi TaxID=2499688 RepID=UPI00254D4BC8|nr:tyrosine-type recombinase/integrase [Niallia taxi]MDK8641301.1 tyrosine-type recombinase/integrase [Niallia taxi]
MQGGVRKRGDNWYYYFEAGKVDGKRKKIERKGGKTKKEAQAALRKALDEFEKTGSSTQESKMSVSDYFDMWFDKYVLINCKYNTQQYYRQSIDKHIKPSLGVYQIKQVKPAILQDFLNKKFLEGYSKSSLKNFLGILSKAFQMAVYPYELIKQNPVQYIHLPKFDKPKNDDELKLIAKDDFEKIVKRFPEGSSFYIPLMIGYHTGMRAAEVCGLTWDCVDLDKGVVSVEKILINKGKSFEFGTPKTASSVRDIIIGGSLITILNVWKKKQEENKKEYGSFYKESNFVCTKENGETVTMNSLKYLSKVVNYELKINFNFHSLRHTHATMLIESGANIKDVQMRLGHSKLSTTMDTYAHVTKSMQSNTIALFEEFLKK